MLLLHSRLALGLVARTVKIDRQLELTVLKQGAEQQQTSFRLEGLKESEMNAKCKQQHSLAAGALRLASKLSIQVDNFFYGSSDKPRRKPTV